MAKRLTCSDVLNIINDSNWDVSDDSDDDIAENDRLDLDYVQHDISDDEEPISSSPSLPAQVSLSPTPTCNMTSSHISLSPQVTISPSSSSSMTALTCTPVPFNPPSFNEITGPVPVLDSTATPLDVFQLYFDDDLFQLLVDQTNLYASQSIPRERYNWYDTCTNELKLFLGIIVAMGIHVLPQLQDYWSSDILLGVPGIVSGMPIDRFKVLLRCFYINDNTTAKPRDDPAFDRLHKIRPLITNVQRKFMSQYIPHREVSVDEAMVGFKGRSSLKQYMPMKPTKRGYKIWCLCDSTNGYMFNFEVYTGASGANDNGGLGPSVVKRLMQPLKDRNHFVFVDNFFSTVDLAMEQNTYSVEQHE